MGISVYGYPSFILLVIILIVMITGFVKLYRDIGLNIMPLVPKTKSPYKGHEWTKYQTEKCTEEFKENDNGAVFCGKVSGNLVVIDLDDKALANEVFKDFEGVKKKTLVVETGKGYHIYVHPENGVLPETSIRITKDNGQHIDIQSQGTYVVMAGSIHDKTGEEYKIISSTLNIDVMNLDTLIMQLGKIGFNVENKRRKLADILKEGVKAGERNDSVFRLAMGLRHSFGYITNELLYHCGIFNQKLVFPPLSDLEVKNIVQSAMSYDIDKIRFKETMDEVKKSMKDLTLKYDNEFWREIISHCKKSGITRNELSFYCTSCEKDMINDPQDESHKTHMITIKYK